MYCKSKCLSPSLSGLDSCSAGITTSTTGPFGTLVRTLIWKPFFLWTLIIQIGLMVRLYLVLFCRDGPGISLQPQWSVRLLEVLQVHHGAVHHWCQPPATPPSGVKQLWYDPFSTTLDEFDISQHYYILRYWMTCIASPLFMQNGNQ